MIKWTKLEDCCEILDYKRIPVAASQRRKGPYPYYGANGVQDYVDDYIFNDDLVLVAEDGGNFGSKNKPIAYRVSGKCWVNNHAHVLKPKLGIDIDYLCYSLAYYNVDNLINGATRKKLTQNAMRQLKIPVLPLNIQKRIVNKIQNVEKIINLRKKEINQLNYLIKARFVEMFGDPGIPQNKWKNQSLKEHISVIGGYAFSSKKFSDSGIPVLRIGNINTGYFKSTNLVYWQESDTLQRYLVYPGELVMSLTGTVGKQDYGNVCILDDSYPRYYLNQRNAKIVINDAYNTIYLKETLEFPVVKQKLTGTSRGVRQANISNKDILNLTLSVPPLSLQNEFANFVQQVDKSKVAVQKSLNETQKLYDSLMQEYFG